MSKLFVILACLLIVALPLAGCSGSDSDTAGETASSQAQATDQTTSTAPASATAAPGGTDSTAGTQTTTATEPPIPPSDSGTSGDGEWITVMTMTSSDEPWQGMDNILVSEPFSASGEARLVLDMPDAGKLDGVIVAVVPADKISDVTSLLDAIQEAAVVTLIPSSPAKTVNDLDGTYRLVNTVPSDTAWTLELQTR